MDLVKGIVKKYFRSYNRTLKDGTKKTYKTEQIQVTIPKSENIFDDKEEVYILSGQQAQEVEESQDMISALELCNAMLKEENVKLTDSLENTQKELYSNSSKLEAFTVELDDSKIELDKSNKKLLVLKEDCSNLRDQLEENKITISNFKNQLDDKNFIIEDLNENIQSLNKRIDEFSAANNDLKLNADSLGLENKDLKSEIDSLNKSNKELKFKVDSLNALNNDLNIKLEELNTNNPLGNGFSLSNNTLMSTSVDGEDSDILVSDVKSSINYTYADYIDLQREYIDLLRKYEESQENLYNEKVKVIHYKSLLDKFKSFIARLE